MTYIRTAQPLKSSFIYHFGRFMNEKTSARYRFILDCVYLLSGDLNVKKKTVQMIGEEEYQKYETACDKASITFNILGDMSKTVQDLASRKEYENIERYINSVMWKIQSGQKPVEKQILQFLTLLIMDTDIENIKIQRTEVLRPEQRSIAYDATKNQMRQMDYRDAQTLGNE